MKEVGWFFKRKVCLESLLVQHHKGATGEFSYVNRERRMVVGERKIFICEVKSWKKKNLFP